MKFFLINFCICYIKGYDRNDVTGVSSLIEEAIVKLKKTTDINMFYDILSQFISGTSFSGYQEESYPSILVKNIILYIENHVAEHITLEKLSEVFRICPSYISTIIKKHTGKNFLYYLKRARMSMAKRILLDPRYLIEEVAYEVGYKNYMTFYKVFTKQEGISPRQFRKSNRIK